MFRKVLLVVPMLACVGCSAAQYYFVTGGIVSTGVVAGVVAGTAAFSTLIDNLRTLIPGL